MCSPGNCSGSIYVLDAETGGEQLNIPYESGYVNGTAISPDGTLLAYGLSTTNTVTEGQTTGTALGPSALRVVDIETGDEVLSVDEDDGILGRIFFNPDGTQVAYNAVEYQTVYGSPSSGRLKIIDLETGETLSEVSAGYLVDALNLDWTLAAISPEVTLPGIFTAGGADPFIVDTATSETVSTLEGVNDMGFNYDFSLAAVSVWNDEAQQFLLSVWNAADNTELASLVIEDMEYVYNPQFSPDGTLLTAYYSVEGQDGFFGKIWGIPAS
jgi:WD40 repeat protein